ncbi:CAP domain-containing protein [Ganoderma leucocontextum]|nr:CAP domain-containing protein [Ganoderma leucocontextum]
MSRLANCLFSLPLLLALLVGGVEATSQDDINAYLTAHNTVRAQRGAANLGWNQTLADAAQTWVNRCAFQHSGGSLGPYGENLAAGTGSEYGIAAAVKSWTDEAPQYNAQDPVPSHFTQVVWKNTVQVGCAVQDCSGIFPPQYGNAKYYSCEYFPAGNVIGQFPQNVQA